MVLFQLVLKQLDQSNQLFLVMDLDIKLKLRTWPFTLTTVEIASTTSIPHRYFHGSHSLVARSFVVVHLYGEFGYIPKWKRSVPQLCIVDWAYWSSRPLTNELATTLVFGLLLTIEPKRVLGEMLLMMMGYLELSLNPSPGKLNKDNELWNWNWAKGCGARWWFNGSLWI